MDTDIDASDRDMVSAEHRARRMAKVQHRLGLHARPAADFVRLANTFASEIRLKKGRRVVNGKSIIGISTLAAAARSRVIVEAEGPDAEEAARVLSEFLLAGDHESVTKS